VLDAATGGALRGASICPSPYARNFDPYHLPPIQAVDRDLDYWLTYFNRNRRALRERRRSRHDHGGEREHEQAGRGRRALLQRRLAASIALAREAHGYGMAALMARAPLRAAARTSPAFGHLSPSAPTMSKVFSNQSHNDSASSRPMDRRCSLPTCLAAWITAYSRSVTAVAAPRSMRRTTARLMRSYESWARSTVIMWLFRLPHLGLPGDPAEVAGGGTDRGSAWRRPPSEESSTG
jgi:hypothetical protein